MPQPNQSLKGIDYFFDSTWFENPATSTIFMRVYVCVAGSSSKIRQLSTISLNVPNLSLPIKITWARINNFHTLRGDLYYTVDEQGALRVLTELVDLDLPLANYAVFATPLIVDGSPEMDRGTIKAEFDKAAALIKAYAGKNTLYSIVAECGYNAKTGLPVGVDLVIERIPSVLEGPYTEPFIWNHIEEILNRFADLDEEASNRLSLALEVLHRAISTPKMSLFYYWTAIELVCDANKTSKIRSEIARRYEYKNQHDVDKKLGYGVLHKWRGELVHKGLHKEIPVDIERFLQTLLIDLIRVELGLENMRFAEKCLASNGFNFSSIGLDDNRSEEQRTLSDSHVLKQASRAVKPAVIQKRILG